MHAPPLKLTSDDAAAGIADGSSVEASMREKPRVDSTLLKTGALQNAIFSCANFASIATDRELFACINPLLRNPVPAVDAPGPPHP